VCSRALRRGDQWTVEALPEIGSHLHWNLIRRLARASGRAAKEPWIQGDEEVVEAQAGRHAFGGKDRPLDYVCVQCAILYQLKIVLVSLLRGVGSRAGGLRVATQIRDLIEERALRDWAGGTQGCLGDQVVNGGLARQPHVSEAAVLTLTRVLAAVRHTCEVLKVIIIACGVALPQRTVFERT